jgi:pantoate--beta-alanine ligase
MERHSSLNGLQKALGRHRDAGKTIALIPTMGALHKGHMSLIAEALEHADIVVTSIFVNPTQFNEANDLEKYPRTVDRDCDLLSAEGCHYVFLPEVKDMYPEEHSPKTIDYEGLDIVMEGAARPGHFDGVVEVVARLFDIVQPEVACFGEKDFQQLAVIYQLVEQHDYPITILPCSIIREQGGLAMSSRNERLSETQMQEAKVISETLSSMKDLVHVMNPDELAEWGRAKLNNSDKWELEYLEVAEIKNLKPIFRWHECEAARAFVAARFGDIRLIDNMELYRSDTNT